MIRQNKIKVQIEEQINANESLIDLEDYLYSYIEEDDLEDFYITSDSIYFDNENLLNKNDKFWELDHVTAISIESIKPMLNDFGKSALLTGKNLESFRSMTEPQLYEGVLDNKSHFYLLFKNNYQNKFSGTYAYKNNGQTIGLDGKLEGNEYQFNERKEKNDEVATIIFRKDGMNLTGIWKKNGTILILNAIRK